MNKINRTYESLLIHILNNGYDYEDPNRKGVKRREVLNYTFRHEFKDGFPAITTKKLNYNSVVTELIWFLRGDTNIKYLLDNGCNIWNKDAYNYYLKSRTKEKYNDCYCGHTTDCECGTASIDNFIDGIKNGSGLGDLGKVYGHYWRNYDGFDQIQDIIDKMINTPMSSEIIVTARNPNDKDTQALPCCHYGFQIVMRPLKPVELWKSLSLEQKKPYIGDDYKKNQWIEDYNLPKYGFELHWQQRSVDTFLGLPFNIASYATLALILEKITGYKALAIQGDLKKVHLYDNSFDAVIEQLSRDVDKYSCGVFDFPAFDEFEWETLDELFHKILPEDITLEGYESYPGIKVEMLERK